MLWPKNEAILKEIQRPVIFCLVPIDRGLNLIGDDQFIIVLDVLLGSFNDPFQDGSTAVLYQIGPVVFDLSPLVSEPAVKGDYNEAMLPLFLRSLDKSYIYNLYILSHHKEALL